MPVEFTNLFASTDWWTNQVGVQYWRWLVGSVENSQIDLLLLNSTLAGWSPFSNLILNDGSLINYDTS